MWSVGVFVNNFVVPGTTPPVDPPEVCDPATQLCTTHPVKVPGFTVAKAAILRRVPMLLLVRRSRTR